MSLSTSTEAAILDHLLRAIPWLKPMAIYVGLFTDDPGEGGSLVAEVAGGGYARVPCGPGDGAWNLPLGGDRTFTNAAAITFASPTGDWGPLTHFGVMDAASGGLVLASGALDSPTTIGSGSPPPTFGIGALRVPFSGHLSDALIEAIGTHLLRSGSWTPPTAIYVGLLTSLDTEVAALDYARQAAGPGLSVWTAPTEDGGSSNAGYLLWPSPTTDWVDAASVGLFDALTAGNALITIPLAVTRTLGVGALPPNFPPGALAIVAH